MAILSSKSPPHLGSFAMKIMISVILLATGSVVHSHRRDGSSDVVMGLTDTHTTNPSCQPPFTPIIPPLFPTIFKVDVLLLQFAQNLEHLECDFFLFGALGHGLDVVAPQLTLGGPPPIGARKANLDNLTLSVITEFGFEKVGHLRILKKTVGGIARPLVDLSAQNFAKVVDEAFGFKLQPPFDPYRDSLSYILASYLLPYVGLNHYVGANPQLQGYEAKKLLAGLLGVQAGEDALIRLYLFERANSIVFPYRFTVAEFTDRISKLRNRLSMCGVKDEGVVVPRELGAEGRTTTNILSADQDSLSYSRTPAEILRILYQTGDEHVPGAFFPRGANGEIARGYLKNLVTI